MDKLDLILQMISGINSRLEKIEERLGNVEARQERMEAELTVLKCELIKTNERIDRTNEELAKTNEELARRTDRLGEKLDAVRLELENKVYPSIRIVAEQNLDLYAKLKETVDLKPAHAALEIRVTALEYGMGQVRETLKQLQAM